MTEMNQPHKQTQGGEQPLHQTSDGTCSRCGAWCTKQSWGTHEAWHENLQGFRQDLQTILLNLNQRIGD